MQDWRDANDYAYCQELTLHEWAWEFLRRNPEYRQAYAEIASARGDDGIEPAKAAGNRFGLLSPVDPSFTAREVRGYLLWADHAGVWLLWDARFKPSSLTEEERDTGAIVVAAGTGPPDDGPVPWPGYPRSCALLFNLWASIDAQLEQARRILREFQETAIALSNKTPPEPNIRPQSAKFPTYIRALDGREAGASQKTIGMVLFPESPEPRDNARRALAVAEKLVKGGYTELLQKPDL